MFRSRTAGDATRVSDALPISVQILTWNSERTLERCLQSIEDCREIFVIDGGSTDNTLAIAAAFDAHVLPQRQPAGQGVPLRDFAAARNVGLEAATQSWILALDSDEVMSWGMREEIERIAHAEAQPAAYLVPRHYVLPDGRHVDFASTYPNERLYFFHRKAVEAWVKPVHERVQLRTGVPVRRLQNGTLAPIGTPSEFRQKMRQYIVIEAEQSRGKGWLHWVRRRVLHTARSRVIASVRLAGIWLIPRKGVRLPLPYEWLRFVYAWRLIWATCPLARGAEAPTPAPPRPS